MFAHWVIYGLNPWASKKGVISFFVTFTPPPLHTGSKIRKIYLKKGRYFPTSWLPLRKFENSACLFLGEKIKNFEFEMENISTFLAHIK